MTKSFNKHHKNLYKSYNNIKYPKIIQEKQNQLNPKIKMKLVIFFEHVYEKNLPPLNSTR